MSTASKFSFLPEAVRGKLTNDDPLVSNSAFFDGFIGFKPQRKKVYYDLPLLDRKEYAKRWLAEQENQKAAAERKAIADAQKAKSFANVAEARRLTAEAEVEARRLEAEAKVREDEKQSKAETQAKELLEIEDKIIRKQEELERWKKVLNDAKKTSSGLLGKTKQNINDEKAGEFEVQKKQSNLDALYRKRSELAKTQLPANVEARTLTGLATLKDETRNKTRYSTNFQFAIPKPGSTITKAPETKFSSYQYLPIDRMAAKCRNMPGILLFHSMGSGKTRTGLGIAASLTNERDSVTIVVPKGLQTPWIDEMESLNINTTEHGGKSQSLEYISAVPWNEPTTTPQQAKNVESLKNLPIYGTLLQEGNIGANGIPFKKFKPKFKTEFRYNIITYDKLLEGNYKNLLADHIVIFDEAHNLLPMYKNSGCDTTQKTRLKQIIESCKRIIFLSGTPIQTEMVDLAILINLCQKRSSDPLIVETPELFTEEYYPPKTAEKIQIFLKQATQLVPGLGMGSLGAKTALPVASWATSYIFGTTLALPFTSPIILSGISILAGAQALSLGLSALNMDTRSLNTLKLSDHAAPYISYFDVMYETPENKTKYPYQSKRYTAGQALLEQERIDKSWKVAQHPEYDEKIYWNTYFNPDVKTVEDAIAKQVFTTFKPYALDRPLPVHGIPAEGFDDEGQNEIAIPFDTWQQTLWVSQFMNLDEETIDIAQMLETYNQDLADTFGESAKDPEKFKKLSEQIINKPSTTKEFMEKMRVITNLSKYCFYYEPVMDEKDDEDISFYNTTLVDLQAKTKKAEAEAQKRQQEEELRKTNPDEAEEMIKRREAAAKGEVTRQAKLGTTISNVGNWQGNKTFVTKLKDKYEGVQIPTDPMEVKSLPLNYKQENVFQCDKFERVLDLIVACRRKYHFIPLVYSNFDKYGFQLFSAFLNNRGFKHLIIHSSDEFAETNQKILNLTQQPFPRVGSSKPSDPAKVDEWRKENAEEFTHYEQYLDKYPKLAKDKDRRAALLQLVKEREYVPMCVLLHPDIKEGLSFTLQPEMMVLEVPMGIGNRDQIYARIIRALSLTQQGGLSDTEYYEVLPKPKLDVNGKQEEQDGKPVMWPGVVRPQYIYDGVFLQENMIAYKTEKTPEFGVSVSGKNIGTMSGLGIRRGMANNIASLRKKKAESTLSWYEEAKLVTEETALSRLGFISVKDIVASQKAHTARVPRVKKIIHQFFGADNLPRVTVPSIMRQAIPTLPSRIRFDFFNVSLRTRECKDSQELSIIELPRLKAMVNIQFFKQNFSGYYSYLFHMINGNTKIGSKTFNEYIDAMPVPWMTTTPDDWISDQNTTQQDQFELIKLSLYRNEARGLCTPEAQTPETADCTRWESPSNPGTCRDEPLKDIAGGTPSIELKADTKARMTRKASQSSVSKKKRIVPIEQVQTVLNSEMGKSATGMLSKQLSKALLADTIAEPLVRDMTDYLKNQIIPQIITASGQAINQIDIQGISNQAKEYYNRVKTAQEQAIKLGKVSLEEGKKKIAEAKEVAENMLQSAMKISGLTTLNSTNANNVRSPVADPSSISSTSSNPGSIGGKFKHRLTYPHHKKARSTRKGPVKRNKTYGRKRLNRHNRTYKH